MSPTFLFELGCEEIPATMVDSALSDLDVGFRRQLQEQQLSFDGLETYATPRRLALLVTGLAERQQDRREELVGPARNVAFDATGKPTRAAEGFAVKAGVPVDKLQTRTTPKGEYLFCVRTIPGKLAEEVLEEVLPRLIPLIRFPKTMYWLDPDVRFIRPIRWFVALLDDRVLAFEFAGIRADRFSRGHPSLANQLIRLDHAGRYVERLAAHKVDVKPASRRKAIAEGLRSAAGLINGRVREDEELLAMVIHLVEWPSVIAGRFDSRYLELPHEVLVTVMKHHQKYFSVVDDGGKILPHFLAVLNTDGDRQGWIRQGHERVLKARLEDASFFWQQDRKKSLAERRPALREIVFQAKLGTYADKSGRVATLAASLAEATGRLAIRQDLIEAAQLCKADLSTDMVKEFTELQGVIGGIYAREDGRPESVWKAIYEHYLPLFLDGALPSSDAGALLSIADKLDSIVGCFSVGIQPKGSSDPFALRRQAQGIILVAIERRLDFSLQEAINQAAELLGERAIEERPDFVQAVMEFLEGRLRFVLKERGLRYDIVNAAVATGFNQLSLTERRAGALAQIRAEEDFQALALSFKRIRNILGSSKVAEGAFAPERLSEEAEKELWRHLQSIRPRIEAAVARGEFYPALKELAGLRQDLDYFFDKVLVMTQDLSVRQNRLKLLKQLSDAFLLVGDISEIVVD